MRVKRSKDERVKSEVARLKRIYKDVPKEHMKLVEGLVIQAARLRVLLDDMWDDIKENGDIEMFSQSDKTEPYERERPVARLYNSRDQSYQRIMKQLSDFFEEWKGDKQNDSRDFSDLI